MDINEAKEYFFRYDGHHFHMGREEPSSYKRFCLLEIDRTTQEQWRQEIIQGYFEKWHIKPDDMWCICSRLIEILKETETDKDKNFRKLLRLIEEASDTMDKGQKILIIERLTESCFLSLSRPVMEEMNSFMETFINFSCSPDDITNKTGFDRIEDRYKSAVKNYKEKYKAVMDNYGSPCLFIFSE